MGAQVEIGQRWVAANRQRRVVCWRKAKASLGQPVGDERSEMLPAANALHVFLRGERGMPGEDLEAVEPAVLDHQEPSCAAKGVDATDGARRAFCDCVSHRGALCKSASVASCAGEESWTRALAEGDGQHPQGGVETEREVRGAGVAEPEMFTPAKFSPVAIESRVEVRRKGFR